MKTQENSEASPEAEGRAEELADELTNADNLKTLFVLNSRLFTLNDLNNHAKSPRMLS